MPTHNEYSFKYNFESKTYDLSIKLDSGFANDFEHASPPELKNLFELIEKNEQK